MCSYPKILLSILLSLYIPLANAQGESNIWYFGNNAGLDFNTSPPTPLTNGALSTSEGCASISDKNGILVFYTDGITVWNKNHVAMPNGTGLLGNPSAVQSAIIVPHPGTYNYTTKRYNRYFIVTVDHVGGPNGVRYSEVDMTLNAGLGDVTATKNVFLYGTTTNEKICVAQHSNNCDFWVIGHPIGTIDYHVYAITNSGFNTSPVISPVAIAQGSDFGSLKASPDSKIVTATDGYHQALYVYDFDNTTGILTPKFSDNAIAGYSYSQEFSPDNKILYYTLLNNPNVYQYDLTAPDNTAFLASRQVIGSTSNPIGYRMCALQLGPDGNIYAALEGQPYLSVINDPNVLGTGCGYVDMQQDLAGRSSTLGLPAIVTSLIRPVNKIALSDSCVKVPIQFSLLDTNKITSFNWYFSKLSSPNVILDSFTISKPVKQFDTAGYYLVTSINQYACYTDTILDTIHILPLPSLAFTISDVSCFGLSNGTITVNPTGGVLPYTYLWNNAGTNATINGLAPSTYSVTVTDNKGCTQLDSAIITEPAAALSVDSALIHHVKCFGGTTGDAKAFVAGGTPPYTYSWNTAPIQTSQQATGLTSGSYTCTISDSKLCMLTYTVTISQPTLLEVNITNHLSICRGSSGTLNSSATGGAGTYSYSWQPGGATSQNLLVSPNNTTEYIVTVTDENNCVTKDSSTVIINPNPAVDFAVPAVCAGQTSLFSDSTSIETGSITTYNWTFGVGSAGSTQQNPSYVYPNCNSYTVSLTAISDSGCTSFNTKPVAVHCQPVAAFSVANVCTYDSAEFNNTSTGAALYAWDYNTPTGVDDSVATPTHHYAPGNYTAQLIAISAFGCKDTVMHTIDVFPAPVANFSCDSVCFNLSTPFIDLSSVSVPGSITGWEWDFNYDSGVDNTNQNPTTVYDAAGTYAVFLRVLTNNGCVDSITKTSVVYPLPDAQYSVQNVCSGATNVFTDLSDINAPDIIADWEWNFADGSSNAITQNTTHLYSSAGTYDVELTVVSNNGCIDSISKTVIVHPNPQANFTANILSGCEPLCVEFQDSSEVASGNNAYWTWTLGDGTSIVDAQNFEHCYTNDSLFSQLLLDVGLTVTSDSGCTQVLNKPAYITVYPKPDAAFSVSPQTTTITNPVITITNLTTGGNAWEWGMGDSQSSDAFTPPPHLYADTGTYVQTLISSNQYNCMDTAYQTIIIDPDFMLYIPNAFSPNDDGVNDSFIPKGMFVSEFEMFIFDRWGNLVYQTESLNKPWDGKANNGSEMAQRDVYVYLIKASDLKMNEYKYRGTVTLIR